MNAVPAGLAASLSGRYRIENELGHGGMATVYLARDLKHNRLVAIKVLHPELAHTLGPERFLREIAITAQLDHPHILPLLDSGVVEPTTATGRRLLYYVMPYVEGETLRDLLKREPQLPIDTALQLFREIAAALDHAHHHGFVHRDLKPENILLHDGHARVADFGIARTMSAVGNDKLTETGLALGTPHYMSPEQAAGEGGIDARTDVYALGCVLYEMLAGNPPFQGPTVQAIMARHAMDPVPTLHTVRSTVPAAVEAAITKALAKVPVDRFSSAAQFVEALSQPVPTPARGTSAASRRASAAGIAAVLAMAVLGGWLFARSRRPTVTPSASVIAVMPFLPSGGDTALARLGRDLALTISANLEGVGGIRVNDSHEVLTQAGAGGYSIADALALGSSLGAGSVVVGDIVREGPDIRLNMRLLSTTGDSEPLARASVKNAPDSISALTDSVTWTLLRQVWRRGEAPSPSFANITTRSVPALRAFLDGERLSQAGNWHEAADAYAAAIKADSSFWLAGWGYDRTRGWGSDAPPNPDFQRVYQSHLTAFGERDRMLIEADMHGDSGSAEDRLARLRAITERFPTDWPAWFPYADALFHSGAVLGHSNAEARAALQRTVDLNPKLVDIWKHLFTASVAHDSVQAAHAVESLRDLGAYGAESEAYGFDASLFDRLALSASGTLSVVLLDSLAGGWAGSKDQFARGSANYYLQWLGFPAAQIELNRRLLTKDPHGPLAGYASDGMVHAWAARGAWDSAIVTRARFFAGRAETGRTYQLAVAGAWLGALDTAAAAGRRAAAVKSLGRFAPEDSMSTRAGRARIGWADGVLAVLRRDPRALAAARAAVQRSGAEGAGYLDRSLAGFEMEMKGAKRAAADSLAALDLAADVDLDASDPYARSLNHLMASRLLAEEGDTSRAVQVLAWHEADMNNARSMVALQVFAPLAYYELARLEEAQGRNDLAREHYQQFLRRYDMPPPAHQQLVDEARASLRKLNGLNDTPAPR